MKATLAVVVCTVALASCCAAFDKPRATSSIRQTSTKPGMSATERARASQAKQCAQRHVDRANGTLEETAEQKHMRDEICGAYYRGG